MHFIPSLDHYFPPQVFHQVLSTYWPSFILHPLDGFPQHHDPERLPNSVPLKRVLSSRTSSWESSCLNPFKHLPLLRGKENNDNENGNDSDEHDINDDSGNDGGSHYVVRAPCCHILEWLHHVHSLNWIFQQMPALRRHPHWFAE